MQGNDASREEGREAVRNPIFICCASGIGRFVLGSGKIEERSMSSAYFVTIAVSWIKAHEHNAILH